MGLINNNACINWISQPYFIESQSMDATYHFHPHRL